jgi:hypothetical protein
MCGGFTCWCLNLGPHGELTKLSTRVDNRVIDSITRHSQKPKYERIANIFELEKVGAVVAEKVTNLGNNAVGPEDLYITAGQLNYTQGSHDC